MAQIARMEVQIEVKSSADRFYDVFRSKLHILPKISPQLYKEGKLVEGNDWHSVGSVRMWSYNVSGHTETVKETIEAIDDQSKTLTINILEGDLLKYYKTYKSILNVSPSGQGCLVNWTLEYVKQNESIPDPIPYKGFLINWTKNIDAYLLKNA